MNPLKNGPAVPHLGTGRGGVKGEVARLRQQALQGVLATLGRKVVWSNGDGDAKTWKEVMALVGLGVFGPDVTPETVPEGMGSMLIEPAGTYDFKHGRFVTAFVGSNGANVNAVPGVVLQNVSMLIGTSLHFQGPGGPSPKLVWTGAAPGDVLVLMCVFGGGVQNDGTVPVIRVEAANPTIIGTILGGGLASSASPIVSVGPSGVLWTIAIESTTGPVVSDSTIVSDDNTALLVHAHTGSFIGFPSNPGFLGTQINVPLTSDGGSGPTAARPSALLIGGVLPPGWKYYDTTIDKPIIVNAANAWVDYAGNPV